MLHGAELVVVPTAISSETDPMLIASQSGAALNQVFFAGVNRVGTEGEMTFIGKSHVVDPLGNVVKMSQSATDDLVLAQVDLDFVTEVRRRQNYWVRDRRPETYGDLTRLLF
jgi:predicted amidohydrolase